jgi:hypothetical protein
MIVGTARTAWYFLNYTLLIVRPGVQTSTSSGEQKGTTNGNKFGG